MSGGLWQTRMKTLIAMSGGVDSSVAAYLTKQQGYSCIGATMKLLGSEFDWNAGGYRCCALDDVEDARSVAHRLEIPYYVFNLSKAFRESVLDRFVCAYENGRTPNPCIDCNRYLKFGRLYQRAKVLGYDIIVTGHYALIAYDDKSG